MPTPPRGRRAVVLGAGIQGCCAALALVRDGWEVTLVDRRESAWSETSLRGEGKLHLGYVYANEPDRATAALMVDAAMAFAPLIDGWLPGRVDWAAARSSTFAYAVHEDSMVDVDTLAAHYAWVDDRIESVAGSYAGTEEMTRARQVEPATIGLQGPVRASFATSEVALSPRLLRSAVVSGLADLDVAFRGGSRVDGVERRGEGFVVRTTDVAGVSAELPADVVVNCLWHDRRRIDATVGVHDESPVLLRLKFALHGQLAGRALGAPSTTVVLGPFGDVVEYGDRRIYASWYPACRVDATEQGSVPDDWNAALDGSVDPERRRAIVEQSLAALQPIIPALESLVVDTVAAGVIVAAGASDIDDPASRLHRRDRIGVAHQDGYVSIETGKLTAAPRHAALAAEAVRPWLG